MSVEVVMPQMGESITEGTVSKWLKKVGDKIEKDEPILEISTDKVDAEVPSPAAGTLLEIRHQEGETVEVGTVLATIGAENEAAATPPAETSPLPEPETPAILSQSQPAASEIKQEPPDTKPSADVKMAAVEVVMPQMGESITEGTVSKWLKKVGDTIEKDEPLLEISTDKVDAEVPSPAAGKLLEIRVSEGQTVEVGSVLALVGSQSLLQTSPSQPETKPAPVNTNAASAAPVSTEPIAALPSTPKSENGQKSIDELRRKKSSPLVRKIAAEHGIDISRIPGSGISGRVTKKDILSYLESGAALRPEDLLVRPQPVTRPADTMLREDKPVVAAATVSAADRVEKMSVMRKKIAEHMVFSKRTSAHVTSVYEIDMTNVVRFRERNKDDFYNRYGTKLTFMPFIFEAVTRALRKYPIVNAQVDGDNIIYKGDINLGMAVALDWGLIVPVIKRADTLSLSGLALAANDLADRARQKKLMPDEVTGGTFTITNPGVFGGLFGTPIINQPQVAILCVGAIEKRPKVFTSPEGDDYIAIRSMAYFALTYDHRIIDGADGERFLAALKEYLETNDFSI
ncbi:MAG: 2-oxoglutarate dehydrogenase, E2 component, dihydrolipoamide succinyltransferase [Pyrinomonadaceae bacterium]